MTQKNIIETETTDPLPDAYRRFESAVMHYCGYLLMGQPPTPRLSDPFAERIGAILIDLVNESTAVVVDELKNLRATFEGIHSLAFIGQETALFNEVLAVYDYLQGLITRRAAQEKQSRKAKKAPRRSSS